MRLTEQNATFVKWCDHLGIPLDPHPWEGPLWDGYAIHCEKFSADGWDMAHEVAHWMVSPKKWRSVPNYGLGPDWIGGADLLKQIPYPRSTLLEEQSSCLGIAMIRAMGDNWNDLAVDHSWWELDYDNASSSQKTYWDDTFARVRVHLDKFTRWFEGGHE